MATWSISWNESRYCCEICVAPVIAIIGEWLKSATETPVVRLVAPGPLVAMHTPGLPETRA